MRKLLYIAGTIAMCWFASYAAHAQSLEIPKQVTAGSGFSIRNSGGGGEFVLVGPAGVVKKNVSSGEAIDIAPEDVRAAGHYQAILGSDSTDFFVQPAKPAALTFLARPSRVPAGAKGVITGVAFVFDEYKNLVLAPTPVKFDLTVGGQSGVSREATAKEGIAWARVDSGRSKGAAQFVASLPGVDSDAASVRRVVQLVASDACNLQFHAQKTDKAISVETAPVKDCSGNPLPDGTIVTFTEVDANGRSTVDARIKKGVARADLPLSNNATISVASGVTLGNEIHIGGGL